MLILQAMEDDYIEPFPLEHLPQFVEDANRLAEDGVYYFNLHVGEVSSEAPYAYCAYRNGSGYFLTVRPAGEVFVAGQSFEAKDFVNFTAGEHDLRVPRGVFLDKDSATKALIEFCQFATLSSVVNWMPRGELGYEMYE